MVTKITFAVAADTAKTMTIPEEAAEKLTRVVDQLSRGIVMREENWETIVYLQNMLSTSTTMTKKSTHFALAEIAMELRKQDKEEEEESTATAVDWSQIVKTMEMLEETKNDSVPTKLLLLVGLQQDAADMLRIPRQDTKKLNKFLAIMKEEYDGDYPKIYDIVETLVEAYQQGTEQEILHQKYFARNRLVAKLQNWLIRTVEAEAATSSSSSSSHIHPSTTTTAAQHHHHHHHHHHRDGGGGGGESTMTKKRKRDAQETRGRLQGLKQARGKLNKVVVDPLQEVRKASSLAAAATAAGRGELLYTKKSSARKLDFSDDEEIEEEDDEVHATHELSDMPAKLLKRRVVMRDASTDGSEELPAVQSKKKWTQKQKTAFVSALKDYGVGNWAAMRDAQHYRKYWGDKNNVQLKDLFRTMKAAGQIPEDIL